MVRIRINNVTDIIISEGNSKMGKVYSFSVSPIVTCDPYAPCHKECYACKLAILRPTVRESWEENTNAVKTCLRAVEKAIIRYIRDNDVKLFRWNVAGDFYIEGYYKMTLRIAKACPGTQFLAFTKAYEYRIYKRPSNYSLVMSIWGYHGSYIKDCSVGYAYFDNGTYPIPSDAKECMGDCENCLYCFNMKKGERVFFKKH